LEGFMLSLEPQRKSTAAISAASVCDSEGDRSLAAEGYGSGAQNRQADSSK
jgi:hypothetical protein